MTHRDHAAWRTEAARHYTVIANAIDHLHAHAYSPTQAAELASAAGLAPHTLRQCFARWAEVLPEHFARHLSRSQARVALAHARNSTTVAPLCTDPSQPPGWHCAMPECEPGDTARANADTDAHRMVLHHGIGASPFGTVVLGWTAQGVCELAFCDEAIVTAGAELQARWPHAELRRQDDQASKMLDLIFAPTAAPPRLPVVLRGTGFQVRVWQALMHSAPGERLSYRELARRAGCPGAVRAVGGALARNCIAWLIPCHRVIRESGEVGQFRWGSTRKLAMQGWEWARWARAIASVEDHAGSPLAPDHCLGRRPIR